MYSVERLLGGAPNQKATIDTPIEHLVACHERIEERLRVLERAVDRMEAQPEEARAALDSVFRYFETSGLLHTEDEERSVFPRMRDRLTAEETEYLQALEEQHREADRLYEELKQRPDRELVARFCALYRAHIASENERLVAAARRVLGEDELAAISLEMKQRRQFL